MSDYEPRITKSASTSIDVDILGFPIAKQESGVKHDQSKEPVDLLARSWLLGVARVLGFGAQKYDRHNWRGGIKRSRLIAAALRHILAYNEGEDLDPESGLNHLYHASCCLMFASEMHEVRPDLDDRFKREEKCK